MGFTLELPTEEEVKQEDNMTVDMMADALEYNDDFWSDFK